MTSEERTKTRENLIASGFNRTSYTQLTEDGSYTETWTHADGSTILVSWAGRPVIPSQSISNFERSNG